MHQRHLRCLLPVAAAVLIATVAFIIQHLATPLAEEDREERSLQKVEDFGVFDDISTRIVGEYEAALHNCDIPTRIWQSYFVFLHSGYPLESHKQAIGLNVDLDSAIQRIYPEDSSHGLFYFVEDLNDDSLLAIRRDVGVDFVECNQEAWLVDGLKLQAELDLML